MKSLSHYLIPDLICDTVYSIPFSDYSKKGVEVVVFDIDNTLVPYDVPVPDEKLKDFLFSLKRMGLEIAFVSNNTPERVEKFNESLGFYILPDSHKPLKSALKPVFEHFGIGSEKLLFVGDQLLTDVLCARLNSVRVVSVPPIKKVETRFFRFKRWIEKPFIRAYYKKKGKQNG